MVLEVDPSLSNPDDLKSDLSLEAAAHHEYTENRSGPLTVLPVSLCYVPVSHFMLPDTIEAAISKQPTTPASDSDPFAEREAILRRRFSPAQKLGHVEYIFDLGNWSPFFRPEPSTGKKYGTMLQILQYPFSRGSTHIRPLPSSPEGQPGISSADKSSQSGSAPTDKPIIDPQYYAGQQGRSDVEIMLHGQLFAEKICATDPLAGIIRGRAFPPPRSDDESNDGLREWIVQSMVTDWHPVGTCSMGGRQGARAGVVDERLRVYGVRGLRVVDASVIPLQISGHTQATVYAIAEKAASMILEDWQSK